MNDQIISAYLKDFSEQYQLAELDEGSAFERFVNYCAISKHHPDPFDPEDVTIGGTGDLGIDGIGILVNDHLVFEASAVDYLKRQLRRLDVQFVFVQSKMSSRFEGADVGTFISGVRQFFQRDLPTGANDDIRILHAVKEHIFNASIDMDRSPSCYLYYATTGTWKDDPSVRARIDQGITDICRTELFSSVDFFPIDNESIRRAYRELHNKVVREINFEKHTILPKISGVQEAYIGILPCLEYLKLLYDDNGGLNRRLFYDNVRDFQGHNPVNNEIRETVIDAVTNDRFALLNNGVTIVARDVGKVGAAFRLKDYQIVNGCQTSHILYLNRQHLSDKVFLPLKLIVTADSEVTNQIIQGTNRQTEVKLEALESLAPFQKKLEEYYLAVGKNRAIPLYYERRSKQYDHLELSRERIVTLPTQINCFVAMFLNEPHSTHRYYGELLSSYRNRLFNESHLPTPYFAAAATLAAAERLIARNRIPRTLRHLKYQLLMVFRIQNSEGDMPPLNSRSIDKYCARLLDILDDEAKCAAAFEQAGDLILQVEQRLAPWREPSHRTRVFSEALIAAVAEDATKQTASIELAEGHVKFFSVTKGFGFVTDDEGGDVFVHQSVLDANGIAMLKVGQAVRYAAVPTVSGRPRIVEIHLT